MPTRWRQMVIAVAAAGVLSGPGIAGAAGNGYGPGNAVPPGVPGGFTSVISVHVVGERGAKLGARLDGDHITIDVPGHAFTRQVQVAVTQANRVRLHHALPGSLQHDTVVFGGGIIFARSGHAENSTKPVSVTLTGANLKVGDVIVAFRSGHFVVIGHVTRPNTVTIDVRNVSEIAVLRP